MLGLLLLALAVPPGEPLAPAIEKELGRLGAVPVWPGFDPRTIPLAVFDGRRTWLFRHPSPPEGFAASSGAAVFEGRHPAVTANNSADLGGRLTATVLLQSDDQRDAAHLAALAIHESFHVFEALRHPGWSGNEAELFVYPVDDPDQLCARRLESEALRRALLAPTPEETRAWARAALDYRTQRYARLADGAVAYERGTELKEGLAQYVEDRALGRTDSRLPEAEFAAEEVRQRAYATGQALALLLDRIDSPWKDALESGQATTLDERLAHALAQASGPARAFSDTERRAARDASRRDVEAVKTRRADLRRTALGAPGWTLEVVAPAEAPLWPQGFDPLNVHSLGGGEVVHTRFLKLGNDAGQVEVLGRTSLTEAAGSHPLFNGVTRLVLTGLASEPSVERKDDALVLRAEGVTASFTGAKLEREPGRLRLRLAQPAR